MSKSHPMKAGEDVYISNPEHPKHGEVGCYAGLADTYDGLEQKHRISFNGDIHLARADDLRIA
ncbi:hypothetical protein [Castellaniella sp.]|uniref:hypothetical protein n=1 Tax=Castellaniella sp. TaxID=1955812 RepID=UPI002AFFBC51|nr:hypothetical protein [Castellaniella sp.]